MLPLDPKIRHAPVRPVPEARKVAGRRLEARLSAEGLLAGQVPNQALNGLRVAPRRSNVHQTFPRTRHPAIASSARQVITTALLPP